MNSEKTYKSYTIHNRERLPEDDKTCDLTSADLNIGISSHESFVEIEIKPLDVCKTHTCEQIIESTRDEKRALFYEMRNIARTDVSFQRDDAKIFYQQGLFMKDFEDNYAGKKDFSAYFPYYQLMGYEQLRTYFTWRTEVRKGKTTDTSVSYAFIYIYELLNNIGVANPQDGLDKLMIFWKTFRVYNSVIDRYLLQWVKDYHIYYPLAQSFYDFAKENRFQIYYPTVFGYESTKEDSFDIFADISKYKIKKSVFYCEQYRNLINDCFYFLLTHFRESFKKKKKCFEDLLFFPIKNETIWIPFKNALFYAGINQPNRQVIISEMEVYTLNKNRWIHKTLILLDSGKQLVGYIIKKMEAELREIVKFKRRLSVNVDICSNQVLKKFKSIGLSLPETITNWVTEFYIQYTAKIVLINKDNLKQIREEALKIQEKLIIPEDLDILGKTNKPETIIVKVPVLDAWMEFWTQLTQMEESALKVILSGQDIKPFAVKNGVMLEVLIDGINQKAMDIICDTLLDLDDTVIIYEEYKERLMKMVK